LLDLSVVLLPVDFHDDARTVSQQQQEIHPLDQEAPVLAPCAELT